MGMLDGKVAIVTGAGHGIGRGHAMELAKHGATVVVNDLGGSVTGEGTGRDADLTVDIINERGGNAVANYADVSDPEQAEAMIAQATGDLGRLEDGRLVLVDRLKDLVLRGGHNVYPSEVEHVLVEHPAVREAAVVGRPDPRLGEEVVAVLTLHEGATLDLEELDTFCRARLSKVKLPREIAIVDAMPLGPSRKILRRTLRTQVIGGELETRAVPQGS